MTRVSLMKDVTMSAGGLSQTRDFQVQPSKINFRRESAATCRKVRLKTSKDLFHHATGRRKCLDTRLVIGGLRKKTRLLLGSRVFAIASSVTWRRQSPVRRYSPRGDHRSPRRKPSPNQSPPR